MTPANIPIATATIKIVLPTFFKSFPANLVAAINPTMMPANTFITIIPFAIPLVSILEIIFIVTAINTIAAAMPIIAAPISFIFPLPAKLVAAINPTMIPAKVSITIIPFAIPPASILETIFSTIVINIMAEAMPIIVAPISFIFPLPTKFVEAINPTIIPANASITIIPFVKAVESNLDICFITNASISIAADISNKVFPTLSIFLPANCVASIKAFIKTPRSTKAVYPVNNSSALKPDRPFIAFDNNNIAAESPNMTRTNLPKLTDSLKFILLRAAEKPSIMAESAAIAPTAPHKSGVSNLDNI